MCSLALTLIPHLRARAGLYGTAEPNKSGTDYQGKFEIFVAWTNGLIFVAPQVLSIKEVLL